MTNAQPHSPIHEYIESIHSIFQEAHPRADERSSEANHIRVLQDVIQHIDSRDRDGLCHHFDDQIELCEGLAPTNSGTLGCDAVVTQVFANFDQLKNQQPTVMSMNVQPGSVRLHLKETGEVRESGEPYSAEMVQVFEFNEHSKLRRVSIVDDKDLFADAMECHA